MANSLYDYGRQAFLLANINMSSDTINCALISNGYTPNLSTDQYYSTVSSFVVGTPQTLSGITTTAGVFNANNVTFSSVSSGSTVSYILLYKSTGTNSTSPLIGLIDTATGLKKVA